MSEMSIWGAFVALFLAGLTSSLHCVGMCGPILLSFSQIMPRSSTRSRAWDFVAYHTGRVWTYAILGFAAGLLGERLRSSTSFMLSQRTSGFVMAAIVIGAAVALTGAVSIPWVSRWFESRCPIAWARASSSPIAQFLGSRSISARLLLGAAMGLIPCGLVYAMLALCLTLPSPWMSAVGMFAFGLGTIPSLSATLALGHRLSPWLRRHGTVVVAAVLLVTGVAMLYRTATIAMPTSQDAEASCHSSVLESRPWRLHLLGLDLVSIRMRGFGLR